MVIDLKFYKGWVIDPYLYRSLQIIEFY